jgi:hypothetical protein
MDTKVKASLVDILQCIEEIIMFLGERRIFTAYLSDITPHPAESNIHPDNYL